MSPIEWQKLDVNGLDVFWIGINAHTTKNNLLELLIT